MVANKPELAHFILGAELRRLAADAPFSKQRAFPREAA
jgi:hypothetical protein